MSDPLRTDLPRAHVDVAPGLDRDAKIEQLLLVGLDHYFAARYELAINVWTRALFLDRSHARARAYIDRARSAIAERQRESEELLHTGVAAFQRGDGHEARRLLQAAIDHGAPTEEALAVLDRLNRFEAAVTVDDRRRPRLPRERAITQRDRARPLGGILGVLAVVVVIASIAALTGVAAWNDMIDWQPFSSLSRPDPRSQFAPVALPPPVSRDAVPPLPRRGETALLRARALTATGHLRDALVKLDEVRATDPEQADADRLRADIQRQLLALTTTPSGDPPDHGKNGERGSR